MWQCLDQLSIQQWARTLAKYNELVCASLNNLLLFSATWHHWRSQLYDGLHEPHIYSEYNKDKQKKQKTNKCFKKSLNAEIHNMVSIYITSVYSSVLWLFNRSTVALSLIYNYQHDMRQRQDGIILTRLLNHLLSTEYSIIYSWFFWHALIKRFCEKIIYSM